MRLTNVSPWPKERVKLNCGRERLPTVSLSIPIKNTVNAEKERAKMPRRKNYSRKRGGGKTAISSPSKAAMALTRPKGATVKR